MRRLILSCLFLSCFATGLPAEGNPVRPSPYGLEVPLESTIRSATVFLQGAQVNREATFSVVKGRGTYVFTDLPTSLDPGSVQVSSKNDNFIILAVSHRINFNEAPRKNPETERLYDQIDGLERRKARLSAEWDVAKAELEILEMNQEVHSTDSGLDPQHLREVVDYQRERRTAIGLFRLAIADSLDRIEEQRELIQLQLAEMGKERRTKATSEIVVITEGERSSNADFRLSYLVRDAGWTPHYDVRVDDISEPVDLRYRAKVRQNSGEDWTDVRLKLSTGDPNKSTTVPTLNTWRLVNGARPPVYRPVADNTTRQQQVVRRIAGTVKDDEGYPLIGATVRIPGTQLGTVTDIDGNYTLDVPPTATAVQVSYTGFSSSTVSISGSRMDLTLAADAALLEEVVVVGYGQTRVGSNKARRRRGVSAPNKRDRKKADPTSLNDVAPTAPVPVQVERKATTVSFDIELPYSIPSDGKPRDVEINRHPLPANYAYTAVPKFTTDAYLEAFVTDWDQFNLLTGEASLFFEGTYLGKSTLDASSTNDTLELSLGVDPNVVITRKETDDYRKRNFLGGKNTDRRAFTVEVRNKKNRPIDLTILDQVPVSGDEKIEVNSRITGPGKLNRETGIITYKLELLSGGNETLGFEYAVKYPRGWRIVLE